MINIGGFIQLFTNDPVIILLSLILITFLPLFITIKLSEKKKVK